MFDGKRTVSSLVIVLFLACAAYYAYLALGWLIAFAFTQPDQWQSAQWNDNSSFVIPMWWRTVYFLVWLTPMIGTLTMIGCAMRFANLIRAGAAFDLRMIRAMQWVGVGAMVAGATVMFANSVTPWIVTRYTLNNVQPLQFAYEPSEFGIMLLGFGVILLGWVLRSALLMKSELEEIV